VGTEIVAEGGSVGVGQGVHLGEGKETGVEIVEIMEGTGNMIGEKTMIGAKGIEEMEDGKTTDGTRREKPEGETRTERGIETYIVEIIPEEQNQNLLRNLSTER